MTKRLLAQSMLILVSLGLLTACPSKEGSEPATEEPPFVPDRLGRGEPVFVDINKAFYTGDVQEGTVSLQSFDPDTMPGMTEEAFVAEQGLRLALNTEADARGEIEFTLLVSNDTVFKVDHQNDEVRRLYTFPHRVCELLVKPRIDVSAAPNGQRVTYTVLDDHAAYVMTANGDGGQSDCFDASSTKVFYELSLNFRFDAPRDQRCVDEDGDNSDPDTCLTRRLPTVDESLARAQPLFGWVDDDETPTVGDSKLAAGMLGYDTQDEALRFYDADGTLQWTQTRRLQTFTSQTTVGNARTPTSLVYLAPLTAQHYLLQLGRDVFVVPGDDFFGLNDQSAAELLNDRVYQREAELSVSLSDEIIAPVEFWFDDDDLLIHDAHKLFYLDYLAGYTAPTLTRTFEIAPGAARSIDSARFEDQYTFSQFDLGSCTDTSDEAACNVAQNPRDASWQFLRDCEAGLGCSIPAPAGEDCDTEAERLADPSLDNPCTVANYLHLTELNDPANDAEFKVFMPYMAEFMRGMDVQLDSDYLWITARMLEKDVLLRYDYSLDLSAPKTSREQLLLGTTVSHYGMRSQVDNDNLYVSALEFFATRSNECYKNHQRVPCDFSETEKNGSISLCTGKDLSEGACVDQINEYKSRALFCSAADIVAGDCRDANLAALQVESADEDAMWLPLNDFRDTLDPQKVFLLLAEDNVDETGDTNLGEGRLMQPEVRAFDPATGIGALSLGQVGDYVEGAADAWIIDDDEGRLDLFTREIIERGGSSVNMLQSQLEHFYFNAPGSGNGQVLRMGESVVYRPSR